MRIAHTRIGSETKRRDINLMRIGGTISNAAMALFCIAGFVSCKVYEDPGDIGTATESPISADKGGTDAQRSERGGADRGGGGNIGAVSDSDTGAESGAGGEIQGGNGGSLQRGDADSETIRRGDNCGDGLVTSSERCDVAVKKGELGYCPRAQADCPQGDGNGCTKWIFNNEMGCTSECVRYQRECINGDQCCPSNCNNTNDSDCSNTCGDGIVQKDKGELCEPSSETAEKCPTDCPDDSDPCTKEELSGKAENCNARCTHVPINSLIDGDKCCQKGANWVTDKDCKPKCGNGVREIGEECDGAEGCSAECKATISPDQQNCIADLTKVDLSSGCKGEECAKCTECMCTNCLKQVKDCYRSNDENKNRACVDVVMCGFNTNCAADACYCGAATGFAIVGCAFGLANGPCKPVIDSAAQTTAVDEIWRQQSDSNTALGRAVAIDSCYASQCQGVCTL